RPVHLVGDREQSRAARQTADRCGGHRHGRSVRDAAPRERHRQGQARARHLTLAQRSRPALGAEQAQPGRRRHSPDAARRGQFPMITEVFAWTRVAAVLAKEFIQVRRDRLTFGMILGIPVMQLTLFGFAINSDPKDLPTAVLSADPSPYARTFVTALKNSGYFRVVREVDTEAEANRLLELGDVQFVINIPQDFSRKLQRGERPVMLVEADA